MDRLARNAMLAKQAGLSYGQWKAMQPPTEEPKEIPDGLKKCKGCGNAFRPTDVRQKYCDSLCRNTLQTALYRERKNALARQRYADSKKAKDAHNAHENVV